MKNVFKMVAVASLIGAVTCCVMLAGNFSDKADAASEYSSLAEIVTTEAVETTTAAEVVTTAAVKEITVVNDEVVIKPPVEFPDLSINVDELSKINEDFVGWVYYEDGKVNYPIVQESEDSVDFYLHHTFDRKDNSAGCLFITYDSSFEDYNVFVFGHNMRDGSMFGSLKHIKDSWQDNPYIFLWRKDHKRVIYRVVNVHIVNKDSDVFRVPLSDESYSEYLVSLGIDEDCGKMLTFSTCYGAAGTSDRLLVHAVEVFEEVY